ALRDLVAKLCKEYPIIELLGHRDTSPDANGSGEVESFEFIKSCPCFDVRSEFSNFMKNVVIKP
ncbi:MAG: N-acetylmuramoyl-L-alanine amidase, partial [Bacteroides sp.]